LHDRDTGLVRFGFRDYDPDTSRWTAKDPILFAGGNVDLYGYCLNDPVNLVDPYGYSAVGDIYTGIVTAISEGAKGGVYSAKQAASDIGQLAIHGDPYVKIALGVAVVSEAAPLACAATMEAPATTAIVVNKVLTDPQGSLDFVTSMFPGTTPTMNWAGVYGATAGTILKTHQW
jgi:RHS repeat-associated protein